MQLSTLVAALVALAPLAYGQEVEAPITARTSDIESDWSAVYYGKTPLLLGNDGTAATGGFRAWDLNSDTPLKEIVQQTPGRTKLVTSVYGINDKDYLVTIDQPESLLRLYDFEQLDRKELTSKKVLGDWSALCPWKSKAGNQYIYLFGKRQVVQFLLRNGKHGPEIVEIQTFDTPVEASSCAVLPDAVYFSGDDDKSVYTFEARESTTLPTISILGEAEDDVTGLTSYVGEKTDDDYLLVAQKDVISVFSRSFKALGDIKLTGDEDIEVQGLSFYQGTTTRYTAGVLAFAIESDSGTGFGVVDMEESLDTLGLKINTKYDPSNEDSKDHRPKQPICDDCNDNGYCSSFSKRYAGKDSCNCFAGFTGRECKETTCRKDCSGHGNCVGANECKCDAGWGGLYCSFLLVEPKAETDANGGDGDDPAIWIAPGDTANSRIITTTKSEVGAGLGVFDLDGKLLQTIAAGEPNNVDMIYGFEAGNRTVDLAYAACRADNTLCIFEMSSDGELKEIEGGSHPVKDDFEVYGSCVYKSKSTGKQYLFVNAKTSEYLQYELTWSDDALQTTLIRSFFAGSGGQVEGCVSDEDNGWVFIGEEPSALWKYGAEPTDDPDSTKTLVAKVGDGTLYADVEGVTLVQGKSADKGFILISCQGVSAYNVYRRQAPHEYVMTFTITKTRDGQVDAVSNTDGIAAVGAGLGTTFPRGLIVTHDDANQLPDGTTSDEASFKLVSLEEALGAEQVKSLGLLNDVDPVWNPRS